MAFVAFGAGILAAAPLSGQEKLWHRDSLEDEEADDDALDDGDAAADGWLSCLPPAAPTSDRTRPITVAPAAIAVNRRPCSLPGWVFRYATTHNTAAMTAKMMHRAIGGCTPSATKPKIRNTTATTSATTAIAEVLPGLLSVSIAINVFFDARWPPGSAGVFCPS